MAMLVFFFRREFRKCLIQWREIKHWVVTKSTCSSRRLKNFPINPSRNHCQRFSLLRQSDHANKMRGALNSGLSSKFGKQFRNSLRVGGVRACIPCRLHSGRAAERRHHKPRIIRKHWLSAEPRIMESFSGCILCKGRSILFELGQGVVQSDQFQLNRHW